MDLSEQLDEQDKKNWDKGVCKIIEPSTLFT